jgi:hypothetical protein
MMSSTAWVSWVLLSVMLHSIFDTVLCRCVTRPIAAADRWPTSLTPDCNSHVAQSR